MFSLESNGVEYHLQEAYLLFVALQYKMKPAGAPPAYKRPSPEQFKGQPKMYKKPLAALRKDAGLKPGEMMYKKPLSSTPRDIVSSVVEAHDHHNLVERIRDGFGNCSSRNIL